MTMSPLLIGMIAFLTGASIGAAIIWVFQKQKASFAFQQGKRDVETQLAILNEQLTHTQNELGKQTLLAQETIGHKEEIARLQTQLSEEQRLTQEKLATLEQAKDILSNSFQTMATKALETNNESFLKLAKSTMETFQERASGDLTLKQKAIEHLVQPLNESLEKMGTKVQELEKSRINAYAKLDNQLASMLQTQQLLQGETKNLVQALRNPEVRGQWGEMRLKRVVEVAGMLEYCDFTEQVSTNTNDGKRRPDMVIHMPNQRQIVVDAKTPLRAYMEALETEDPAQKESKLRHHAQQVRDNLVKLSSKSYWRDLETSPDFVIMFLPGESFYSEALRQDPALIEYGVEQRVMLATPTTLIALLKAVAYGWNEQKMARHAEEIRQLGKDLYDSVSAFSGHYGKLGDALTKAAEHYNKTTGSLERNVLSKARKLKSLGIPSEKQLSSIDPLEKELRMLQSEETLASTDSSLSL